MPYESLQGQAKVFWVIPTFACSASSCIFTSTEREYLVSGQGPTQDLPRDPKTSGEWNTTSARRQVRTPDIWAPSLQEESLPAESTLTTETQERASLPGLLIEANRITRGTSSNQRQL